MRTPSWPIGLAMAALAAGCGTSSEPEGSFGDAPPGQSAQPAPGAPAAPAPPGTDFDRERALAEAESLLGLDEDRIDTGPGMRIVRRGDESFPSTMDLRPGRKNVELDDDGAGRYVVTRVVVEVPAGQERIVVE